jgi:hypothetical protein
VLDACRAWSLHLPASDTAIYAGMTTADRLRRKREAGQPAGPAGDVQAATHKTSGPSSGSTRSARKSAVARWLAACGGVAQYDYRASVLLECAARDLAAACRLVKPDDRGECGLTDRQRSPFAVPGIARSQVFA